MLAKIRDKRIAEFKKVFPEYKTSKSGNLYYEIDRSDSERTYTLGSHNATKSQLKDLGKERSYPITNNRGVVLITKTGKVVIKPQENSFRAITMKSFLKFMSRNSIRYNIKELFFTGRKFEWLKRYPQLWDIRCFQNFTSLKSAKIFMGYEFISDAKFYSVLERLNTRESLSILITRCKTLEAKRNSVALVLSSARTFRIYLLIDSFRIAEQLGHDIVVPRTVKQLYRLHDHLVELQNSASESDYSDEDIEYKGEAFRELAILGIDYSILSSPRKLFKQGVNQKHCIGSYTSELTTGRSLFLAIKHENKEYDLQVKPNGTLGQFYGKCNTQPPTVLKAKVKSLYWDWKVKESTLKIAEKELEHVF